MYKLGLSLIAGTLVLLVVQPAMAAYPAKDLRMIAPYSAGGGTDIMARTVAQFMEVPLGQKVVVVNKPGASGQIGTAESDVFTDKFMVLSEVRASEAHAVEAHAVDAGEKLNPMMQQQQNATFTAVIEKNRKRFPLK